ncbi:MAG: hypothetical protein L0H70_07350 [Xanthomonadales bacterium]|nr:hypothetical protein [Xanthomonadales bacterium]
MLPGICPSCGYHGDLEGFLVEGDARRAIARAAALEPAIGKLLPAYLRLFSSGKRGLQLRRVCKLIDELVLLVEAGTVCRDGRIGVLRPATPAMWVAGLETMLANPPSGQLDNHRYLIVVVYGLADAADAAAERQREERARGGAHLRKPSAGTPPAGEDRLINELQYLRQMHGYGQLTDAQYQERVDEAKRRGNL